MKHYQMILHGRQRHFITRVLVLSKTESDWLSWCVFWFSYQSPNVLTAVVIGQQMNFIIFTALTAAVGLMYKGQLTNNLPLPEFVGICRKVLDSPDNIKEHLVLY